MRQRHQRTPSKAIVRYQRQATWSKKPSAALQDRSLNRWKKVKVSFAKR